MSSAYAIIQYISVQCLSSIVTNYKRGRQSSGSSSDQNTPKVAKPGTDSSDQEDGEGDDDESAPIDKGVEKSGRSGT